VRARERPSPLELARFSPPRGGRGEIKDYREEIRPSFPFLPLSFGACVPECEIDGVVVEAAEVPISSSEKKERGDNKPDTLSSWPFQKH